MKLSTKLYLGFFVIPALVLLGTSAYSIYSFRRIDRQIQTIYDDRIVPLKQIKLISDDYAIVVIDSINKAHAGIIKKEESLQLINEAMMRTQDNWKAYKMTNLTAEEMKLANEVESLLTNVDLQIEQVKQILKTQNLTQLQKFDGPFYAVIDPLTKKLQELSELQLSVATAERGKAKKVYQETLVLFGLLLASTITVASPIGFFLSRSITATFKETIKTVSNTSTEIAVATEEYERIATSQVLAVNQTTATMDELSAASQTTAKQAQTAAIGAQKVLALADSGTQAVELSVAKMETLKNKVEEISRQITHLSQQTSQIGNIISLVSDLANQTNMLALNAAVEAVRAGDYGKGFAVVAAEIRKLADQSKKSAERINALVVDTENAINLTIKVTEEGTSTVAEGMEIAEQTADSFAGVKAAINDIVLSTQQIALTVEQQASAVKQVLEAMNSLNVAAQETAASISQTKIGMKKLNQMVVELDSTV